jgi:hypothetical protein
MPTIFGATLLIFTWVMVFLWGYEYGQSKENEREGK